MKAFARSMNPLPEWKAENDRRSVFIGSLVYRPLALRLVPIFVTLRISANAITWFTILGALLLPFIPLMHVAGAGYWIGAIAAVLVLLDFADGAVARSTGSTGPMGAYLDSAAGVLVWVSLFASTAFAAVPGVQGQTAQKWVLATALLPGLLYAFDRQSRFYARAGGLVSRGATALHSESGILLRIAVGYPLLLPFFVLVATALSALDLLHVLNCLYAIAWAGFGSVATASQIRRKTRDGNAGG